MKVPHQFLQGYALLMAAISLRVCAAPEPRKPSGEKTVPFQQQIVDPENIFQYSLYDIITLMQKANSGNPAAQHELGICYLTGRHFSADTLKAAYWIGKAADQNLVSARYNLGIFLNNGWGIPWDPFKAYRHIRFAAEHGLMEAQYVYGLFFTENLIVPRDDDQACRWISLAAEAKYPPALLALTELEKLGIVPAQVDTSRARPSYSSAPLPSNPDSVKTEPASSLSDRRGETVLLKEALNPLSATSDQSNPDSRETIVSMDRLAALLPSIVRSAEAGCPEALTFMGRFIEKGEWIKPDEALASVYYLRAIRNHSPRAPALLEALIRKVGYFERLKSKIDGGDPVSQFVWADLVAFGLDWRISEIQALSLLEASASNKNIEATLDLGLLYYSGKWVSQNREKGTAMIRQAADWGSREARIRLWMIELGSGKTDPALVDSLFSAYRDGSLFAQAMLGTCYRQGVGVARNIPKAVLFYRDANRRGSQIALHALREMVNELRPDDPEFQINE